MAPSSSRTAALAAVAVEPRRTELREFPLPEIAPDAGLMRIEAAGVCGSDWPMYLNAKPGPRILGHEMIGTIERLGDIARARWGVNEGDVVALEEYLPCGHCEYCRTGEYRSCLETDTRLAGSVRYGSTPLAVAPALWGGYSQYLYMHPRTVVHRVPPGLKMHIAAMALPIGNGFQWAFLDGGAGPGKTVVVQGPGQQGLGCVIAAKTVGAELIIVSGLARDERRMQVARELGADHTIAVDQADLVAEVTRITGGRMADIVIDVSGAGPEIVNPSVALLRKRGVLLAAARKGAVPGFDINQVINRQVILRGTRGHSFGAVELALRTMASNRFPLERMSSHVVGLKDVDEALRMTGGETAERSIHITVAPWS
ncbi:MAG TPA: zinc-binding dehydrogenase [Stellaceae bacterium]|nr:zinc-binding dehydrogenase [Stellaceae bacterium]